MTTTATPVVAPPSAGDMTIEKPRVAARRFRPSGSAIVMGLYLLFLMLPIYWLLNMSLKTNNEILG
jgi:glycerol transport system permease protein